MASTRAASPTPSSSNTVFSAVAYKVSEQAAVELSIAGTLFLLGFVLSENPLHSLLSTATSSVGCLFRTRVVCASSVKWASSVHYRMSTCRLLHLSWMPWVYVQLSSAPN